MKTTLRHALCVVMLALIDVSAQQKYDFLLKGGHVIDPRNRISAVRDVAIANGKIAAVAANIAPGEDGCSGIGVVRGVRL
jgi:dihydroorotase